VVVVSEKPPSPGSEPAGSDQPPPPGAVQGLDPPSFDALLSDMTDLAPCCAAEKQSRNARSRVARRGRMALGMVGP
jgi:hypothetical protein